MAYVHICDMATPRNLIFFFCFECREIESSFSAKKILGVNIGSSQVKRSVSMSLQLLNCYLRMIHETFKASSDLEKVLEGREATKHFHSPFPTISYSKPYRFHFHNSLHATCCNVTGDEMTAVALDDIILFHFRASSVHHSQTSSC